MTKKITQPLPAFLYRSLRHLLLAAGGTLIIYAVAFWADATGDNNIMNLGASETVAMSLGAAYAASVFLVVSLLVGPYYVLRDKPLPVSSYLRRDFGIWAAVFALLHTFVGLQVYPAVPFWEFFLYPTGESSASSIRFDVFGIANHLGAIAALLLLLLLCLSSNAAIRLLQVKRWKRIQRWVYAAAGMTLLHGFMYQLMGQRTWVFVAVFVVFCVGAIAGQLWGAVTRRRRLIAVSSSEKIWAE